MLPIVMLATLLASPLSEPPSVSSAPATMEDTELAASRGGFTILNGQELSFSADIRSFVDGQQVLETRLSVTDQGMSLSTAPLTGPALGALSAAGVSLGAAGQAGQVFVSADGQTAFVQGANDGQIANLLVNTGSGRDLRLETSLNLNLPGFEATQSAMRDVLAGRALASDIVSATVGR